MFKINDKVKFAKALEIYPLGVVPAGTAGTIDDKQTNGTISVRLDDVLPFLFEYENTVFFEAELGDNAAEYLVLSSLTTHDRC